MKRHAAAAAAAATKSLQSLGSIQIFVLVITRFVNKSDIKYTFWYGEI